MSKRSLISISALGILGLIGVASAQEPAPNLQTPDNVSATANESGPLAAGQVFPFTLHFHPAPDGYKGGAIHCTFTRKEPSNPPDVIGSGPKVINAECGTDLRDGQSTYDVSVKIDDYLQPGEYELTEVTLKKSYPRRIPVDGRTGFTVRQIPAVVIHVEAPKRAIAGQQFVFREILDRLPKSPNERCRPILSARIGPSNGANSPYPNPILKQTRVGELDYEISTNFETDAPSGRWVINSAVVLEAFGPEARASQCDNLITWTGGDIRVPFEIESGPHFVTPTSVTVTPLQINLLRAEAERLRTKADSLQERARKESSLDNQDLQKSVEDALSDLNRTQSTITKEATNQAFTAVASTYFKDIRREYDDALKLVQGNSAELHDTGPRFQTVALGRPTVHTNAALQAVVKSFRHNQRAYEIVADTAELTFNLDVYSDPPGATISYKIEGDPKYLTADHDTDWKFLNLDRAVYWFRFEEKGYSVKEQRFDAMEDSSTSLHVRLVKATGTPWR